jgi:hypothetical protein
VTRLILAAVLCVWPALLARAQDALPRVSDRITVVSEPSGAEVWSRDSLLGTTPIALPLAFTDTLTLFYPTRDAWPLQRVQLAPPFLNAREGVALARFPRSLVLLPPERDATPQQSMRQRSAGLAFPRASIAAPALAGLGAGIAAVVLKQKADRCYDAYLLSADPALLEKTRSYDLAAGIAIAVLEAGVVYLAYLLFVQD